MKPGRTPALGPMRDRLTLQARTVAVDRLGSQLEQWADVATVWAEVVQIAGREVWNGQQVQADVTTGVRIRYYPGLAPRWRFVQADGSVLAVKSAINPDGRRIWHQCQCVQVVT